MEKEPMKKITLEFDEDSVEEVIIFVNKLEELVAEVDRLLRQLKETKPVKRRSK